MKLFIDKKDLEQLAQIVRDETGNHVSEKNFAMLESRIRSHILKLDMDDMDQYWSFFAKNEESEREILQSLMTTHYTYFFREMAHFDVLEQWLQAELPRIKERYEKYKTPLMVWSAACSRGQEVYSLAMFLEAILYEAQGIPYEIVGTDIDVESVAYAQNGVYPMKEVNTIPRMYLHSNWKKGTGAIKDFAAVHPNLRQKVKFEALNLLEISKWKSDKQFDVIFCRNVFIYFSQDRVEKIATDLKSKLQEGGLFISGMSEPLRFTGWDLQGIGPSSYKKVSNSLSATTTRSYKDSNEGRHLHDSREGSVRRNTTIHPSHKVNVNMGGTRSGVTPAPRKIDTNPAPTSASRVSSVPREGYHVLCVDDSPTIQTLLKKIFSSDPACEKIEVASSAKEAREKLNKHKFDLVTLDIHMPEVTGIEFLEKMYNKRQDPPVVMISSVNRKDIEHATKSLTLGAFDYVEKPAMNNLSKSRDEILTKAKLAIRSSQKESEAPLTTFDKEIGVKVVVPDASQCVRIVLASNENLADVEQIVKSQANEYRSPALVIIWRGDIATIESKLLQVTSRKIRTLREFNTHLRPNLIYVVANDKTGEFVSSLRVQSISLQVLDHDLRELTDLHRKGRVQMLVTEELASRAYAFESAYHIQVSDITPATSFSSLSVEFFANLRKAAA